MLLDLTKGALDKSALNTPILSMIIAKMGIVIHAYKSVY